MSERVEKEYDKLIQPRWQFLTYMFSEVKESIQALIDKNEKLEKENANLKMENKRYAKRLAKYEKDEPIEEEKQEQDE